MAKILIIDDDAQMIQQLTERVTDFGHTPESSMYPGYLMEILNHQPCDLILMDMHMPDVDGLTLLTQLKANAAHRHIPVIMLTADTEAALLTRCFEAGAHDFINKPVNPATLRARIESALHIKNLIDRLTHMNQQLKSIFDGMAEGVVTLDDNFRVHMVSAKASRMLDIDENDAVGKPGAAVLGSTIAGPKGVLMNFDKQPVSETRTQILCASGAVFPVTLTVTVTPFEYGSHRRGLAVGVQGQSRGRAALA